MQTGHFELNESTKLEPSVMVQIVDYANLPSIDINMKSHHFLNNLKLSFGASYRFGTQPNANTFAGENLNQDHKQLTLLTGLQFKGFSFFYTYTHSFEDIQIAPFNSHQFTLGFDPFIRKIQIPPCSWDVIMQTIEINYRTIFSSLKSSSLVIVITLSSSKMTS